MYRGDMNTLPSCPASGFQAPCLYLLQFRDRCKVGISSKPPDRLKTLHTTHRQTSGSGVILATISEPTAHAYRVEQSLLSQFGVLRLAGEYLAVDFATLCAAATNELKRVKRLREPPAARAEMPIRPELKTASSMPVRELAPRVVPISHGRHRYAVEWNLHESALHVSEWRTLRKCFDAHAEAVRFCLDMWRIWLATLAATGLSRDRVLLGTSCPSGS